MLKKSKTLKKILAMLTVIITLLGVIQPTIMAANQTISGTGSEKFMARQYASRLKTTDPANGGENGIIARRLILRNAGWQFGNR